MASNNKEILAKAVTDTINSDEPIDLLLISKSLDSINGESVATDTDYGMHFNYLYIGMSGQHLKDDMNSNLKAIDTQFAAQNDALNVRIISNQIKEIKVENGVTYYTTDTLDSTAETDNRTWVPLQSEWGKITGDITTQKDLADALAAKANKDEFTELQTTVGKHNTDILNLQNDLSTLSNTVDELYDDINGNNGILVRLSAAEVSLAKKISSDKILEIRLASDNTSLEYTTDGTSWHPVSSAGVVEWRRYCWRYRKSIRLKFNYKKYERRYS